MSAAATEAAPKSRNLIVHIALWVLQVLLALAFGMAGFLKVVTPAPELVEQGMAFAGRLPAFAVTGIGVLEVLGAIGLILPAALRILPRLTPIAAACLTLTMIVAAAEHVVNAESIIPTVVLGALTLAVAVGRLTFAPILPRGQ